MTDASSRSLSAVKRFPGHLVPGMDDIRAHKPILAPVVAGWLLAFASAWSLWPFMTSALPPEQIDAVGVLFWGSAVLAPFLMLAKAGVLAVVGWAVLILSNSDRRLRSLYSILLYGEAVLAAQGVFAAILLRATTDGAPHSPEDLKAALGLAALMPADSPVLQAMASGLTLLHVAWYAFLYVCFRRALDLGRLPACALAALFWLALLGFAVAGASFL